MDQRDCQTWVVLELSHSGEVRVAEGTLESCLRRDLGIQPDFPIFIPVMSYPRGNRTVNIYLMEGYAFVGSGLPEVAYFALEQKDYVSRVMSTPGRIRSVNVIPDSKVKEMRTRLREMAASDVTVGSVVRVTDGTHHNLEGTVMELSDSNAIIRVELRSLDLIITVPVIFVEVISSPHQG